MIVSDKTYTDLSNLSEDQREIVIKDYQDWLDESGLEQDTIFDEDLIVRGEYKFCRILKTDGKGKVFVDGSPNYNIKVTFEEIEYDRMRALCIPPKPSQQDPRIEHWHKTCDLVTEYAGASEVLAGFYEGLSGGDSYLKIIEEGLKLRQNKRKQEIEDAEYAAKKAEEELVKGILERWKWEFDELGFSIWFNELEKVFEITNDTGDSPKYKVSNELGIEHIHKALDSLDDYL